MIEQSEADAIKAFSDIQMECVSTLMDGRWLLKWQNQFYPDAHNDKREFLATKIKTEGFRLLLIDDPEEFITEFDKVVEKYKGEFQDADIDLYFQKDCRIKQ